MTNFQANVLVQQQWAKYEATHGCVDQHRFQELVAECLIRGITYCIIGEEFYTWSVQADRWMRTVSIG